MTSSSPSAPSSSPSAAAPGLPPAALLRRTPHLPQRPIRHISWFRPDGAEMTSEDWNTGFAKSLGVFLNGDALPDPDRRGHRISDDSFLLLFTAHYEDVTFVLPTGPGASSGCWTSTPPLSSCRPSRSRREPRSWSPPADVQIFRRV